MITADAWNRLVESIRRALPLRGVRCKTSPRADGVVVSGKAASQWQHPWFISPRYEYKEDGAGEWRASIKPGFVNGRDTHIPMPPEWPDTHPHDTEQGSRDVPLTDDPPPYLVLGDWRNPLAPSGFSASASGELIAAPADGYPKFFERLGVRAAAKGGNVREAGALDGGADPERTRELRAIDIVLSVPRIGTRLSVETHDPLTEARTESISTVFLNDYLRATGGRARLRATARYEPPEEQSLAMIYGTLLNDGDPQVDELKMATVWMVSPPDAGDDAMPDATWTPYPQHFVFWNLQHATRFIPQGTPGKPLQVHTGLAGGLGDLINDALLAPVNDAYAEIEAFLHQADVSGMFWST